MKKKTFLIYTTILLSSNAWSGNNIKSNFSADKNVSTKDNYSVIENDQVVFFRNDSAFVATINEDGELQNISHNKDLEKLQAEGQIAFDNTNKKAYYTKSGKMFVADKKENGKWSNPKAIVIKGSAVSRDKYRGSVLAYANWRYMPKDSVVVLNPAITQDGTRLYFASNMKDSKGLDIWYADIDENGELSEPVRLSDKVNSVGEENFPFVRENGSITFASNKKDSNLKTDDKNYNIYCYNPNADNDPILLANMLEDELKEPELFAEKVAVEPTEIAQNVNNDNNNDVINSNLKNEDKKGNANKNDNVIGNKDVANNKSSQTNNVLAEKQTESNNSTAYQNSENKTNGVATVGDRKSENDKIVEALNSNKDDKSSIDDLNKMFDQTPDAVVKASQNVVATNDKRIFYFDYDKDVLNGNYAKDIDVILDFIKAYPKNNFLIIGHTDERGSYEYNDALSLKRANKIKSILVSKGISKDRLHVIAVGEYQPVIPNAKMESEHQKNRRVEIQRMD